MTKRRAWGATIGGLALLLSAGLGGFLLPAKAQEGGGTGVGGYNALSIAAATRQIYTPQTNIIPAENLLDLSVPYALSNLTQGSARAVGSTAWPGDTFATACRAQAGVPCYPFYAEAFFPQGPADGAPEQTPPGSSMVAHAEELAALGKGEFTPQGASGFGVGASTATSTSNITGGAVTAESVSRVNDIILGGGAVHIESVLSITKATSDGTKADATGSTSVVGLTVAGIPVAINENGVSLAGQINTGNPLAPALDPVLAALTTAGITLKLAGPVKTVDGAHADVLAGGLIVSMDNAVALNNVPNEVRTQLPLDPTGKLTLVFGQASALADATPGFAEALQDETPAVPDITPEIPTDVSGNVSTLEAAPLPADTGAVAAPASAAVQPASVSLPSASSPIGLGLVILACVGAAAMAFGLRRLGTDVFQPVSVTACPLEKP
jgi:hypothetical protein